MKRNTAILRGLAAVTALGTMLCTTATTLTFTYSGIINSYLNINTTKIIQPDNANGVVEAAYDNEYVTRWRCFWSWMWLRKISRRRKKERCF